MSCSEWLLSATFGHMRNYGPADRAPFVYAVLDTCLQSQQQCGQLGAATVSSHTNQVTVSRNVFT
jgi:hypothetical protein